MNEVNPFSVLVVVCAHQVIKADVCQNNRDLEKCPNPTIKVKEVVGDALISRSRNRAATWFLEKSKCDLLMFVDDDVKISPFDSTKLMNEAYQMNLPIVGAAYVTKSKENPGFAIRPVDEKVEVFFGKDGGLYDMRSISTGCMVIRREVLQKFVDTETAPKCHFGNDHYYSFFKQLEMVINGVTEEMSEDWWFCEKAISLGYKIYCDTTIKTAHIGLYEYTWDDLVEIRNGMRKTFDSVKCNIGNYSEKKDSLNAA